MGRFRPFSAYTSALPSACRGAFYALKSDGTVVAFAGTIDKLYRLNNTDFTWIDVSLDGGAYSALSSAAQWQFAQTGNFVFATQANALLQVFDLSSPTTFAKSLGIPAAGRLYQCGGTVPGPLGIALDSLPDSMVGAE